MIKVFREGLPATEQEFDALGLTASLASVKRMRALAETDHPSFGDMAELAREVRSRVIDEIPAALFLVVDEAKAGFYTGTNLFGPDVADHFPSAIVDIEEAGKCLALGRATACVFHLMRVMEVGLRVVARTLEDPSIDPSNSPNWGTILTRCHAELSKPKAKRSAQWASDDEFYSGAAALLVGVKNAWRNPIVHVALSYDDEKALDVWNAVRAFMRHLATKLTE